jgi:SAM-dependent methyltransferase
VLQVLRELDKPLLRVATNDPARWDAGWGEILARVKREGVSRNTLRPQYFRYGTVRFMGDYAQVESGEFEYDVYRHLKTHLFDRYLRRFDRIVELGCGTGQNLYQLGLSRIGRQLIGCDWARPTSELLPMIAKATQTDLNWSYYNLLTGEGGTELPIDRSTAVITLHALEQVGDRIQPFLDLVADKSPGLCLHVEPLCELYDNDLLFDHLAAKYHERRNYLRGLVPAVQALAAEGKAQVLDLRRLYLGSMFQEGYSLLVWRVL